MLLPLEVICPHCAQLNETSVDPSQGRQQTYVEDCQVCCRPLALDVRIEDGAASADAVPEAG